MGHHAKVACPVAIVASTLIVFLFALLVLVIPAQAQTKSLLPVPKIQFLDLNGNPLAGGKVETFISGTSTPQATFTDQTGATPNANPVILDAAGRSDIWLTPGLSYRITVKNSSDVQQWSVDGVTSGTLSTNLVVGSTAVTFTSTPTFDSSANAYFRMTLTGNVTSSTISNSVDGGIIYFNICQDATGGRTFTWPASVLNAPTVGSGVSVCTSASFIYDGTNWREIAPSSRGSAVFDALTAGVVTADGKITVDGTDRAIMSGDCGLNESSAGITITCRGDVSVRLDNDNNGTNTFGVRNGGDVLQFSVDEVGIANAVGGYQVNGAAASGNVLEGDGTKYVSRSAFQQIWRGGFYETAPATGLTTIPLPVSSQCATGISVEKVSVAAISKGSGTMTFQVTRYNSAGASQGDIFSGNQTYSNTGDNRQDYNVTTTTATANDYFRFNIVTTNAQADVTFIVEGKCNVL